MRGSVRMRVRASEQGGRNYLIYTQEKGCGVSKGKGVPYMPFQLF
jgi:hypothetical protein